MSTVQIEIDTHRYHYQSKGTHKCSDNLIELYYPSLSLLYVIIGTTILVLLGPGGRSGFTISISHVTFDLPRDLGFYGFAVDQN